MRTSLTLTAMLAVGAIAAAPVLQGPADLAAVVQADGAGFVEVTFDHALVQADRDLLGALGASAVSFTGPRTYRAYVADAAATQLATTAGVAAVRTLRAGEKLDRALDVTDLAAPVTVAVRVAAAEVTPLVDALAANGIVHGTMPVAEVAGAVDVIAAMPGAVAASLAELPSVAYVGPTPTRLVLEDERTAGVMARLSTGGSDASFGPAPTYLPTYREFLADLGIDGSGVVVAIVDDGVDEEHPQLNVVATKDYPSPHDEPIDATGHGTHVAGIVGGTGAVLPDAVGDDADGFAPGVGVAPGVGLTNQNLIATSGVFTNHVSLFEQTVADAIGFGANIWNASWTSGEGTGVGYLASGARLDALIRDGDPAVDGLQKFIMAFSAGNSGPGPSTITAPKEAKNLIVVGSVDAPTDKPYLAATGDPRNVSSFSSRGPTVDGRFGITVVAPGADVRSTKSLTQGGLCFEPVADPVVPIYSFCSGTSMASPHAAGAAALVTQWWREGEGAGADPSPALVKALLVNSAVDIMFPDVPNADEGWGRIDLAALFSPGAGRTIRDESAVMTDPGERHVYAADVDGTTPLKITVAWSDVPGDPAADVALVSDLDLVVTAPDGTTYLGNRFAKGWSTTGGTPDRLEVLENVYVAKPMAGVWTVEVVAHALPADGALLRGDGTDQDYALVVTGLR